MGVGSLWPTNDPKKTLLAKVNQHPPMDQLVILSMGWVAFFHLASISQLFLVFD
jgi:hypothetical protein